MPLLKRQATANKGDHGSLGILGGAQGTVGAAFLSARCALYSGSGRVFVVRPSLADGMVMDPINPEVMVISFLQAKHKPINAWAVGPGLGMSDAAHQMLKEVLALELPMVLDADALNLIAEDPALTLQCANRPKGMTIITPHPGETARLLQKDVLAIESDRIKAAHSLAQKFQAIALLKGAGSVIADIEKEVINPSGNVGLATAGTGDVLTGLIGSFLAQGLDSWDAACQAALIHGKAAERLSDRVGGVIGLTAGELIPEIRFLVNQ